MTSPDSNTEEETGGEEIKNKSYLKKNTARSKSFSIVKRKIYTDIAKPILPKGEKKPTGSIEVILDVLSRRRDSVPRNKSNGFVASSPIVSNRRNTSSEPTYRRNKSENDGSPVTKK